MHKSYRETSKENWGLDNGTGFTMEHIKCGSLQRIADACETMAKSNAALIDERDRYKRWYEDERERSSKKDNTIRGLRGAVTKLRKAVKA